MFFAKCQHIPLVADIKLTQTRHKIDSPSTQPVMFGIPEHLVVSPRQKKASFMDGSSHGCGHIRYLANMFGLERSLETVCTQMHSEDLLRLSVSPVTWTNQFIILSL